MKKYIVNILFILTLLSACSLSHKDKVLRSIKESSVSDSYVMYKDYIWYNFKNQDEELIEKYELYLDEIVDYISSLKLTEVSKNEFTDKFTFAIKAQNGNHEYLFDMRFLYPSTYFLKLSIDDNNEYYKLTEEESKTFTQIFAFSKNAPFNNITRYEYRENELRNK